jgi:hypothetical protein
VGGQIVEDDVKLAVGIRRHDAVHEVEELDAPAPPIVAADHLTCGDLQGSEQRRRSMPLVIVRLARHGASVRQLQIALGTLQRLDRGLLIH